MKNAIVFAMAFFAVAVCASADSKDYHASSTPGASGYFNAPDDSASTQAGRWVVGYTGDPGVSRQKVAEFALQRASELAAEQHQEWFAVISTTSRMVQAGAADDLTTRAGHFMGTGPQATAAPPTSGAPHEVNNTPSFGGSQVPNDLLEHWAPRRVGQTVLIIQLGSGDHASFPGMDHQPQIFPAAGAAAAPSAH